MSQPAKIIIAVVLVAVLAGGAIWIGKMQKQDKNNPSVNTSQNANTSPNDNQNDSEIASTITYNGSTFSITKNTIKSGDKVKVVNSSRVDLEFDSDPHPVHTDNKELNVNLVAPGESKTFSINKAGTWGFHNHLNASQRGSITVE